MAKSSYFELLKDPRWQKRRLEVMSRDEFTCQQCYAKDKELHVHHKFYESAKKPWEYADDQLMTLCRDCHEGATRDMAMIRSSLSRLDPGFLEYVRGYVDALANNLSDAGIEVSVEPGIYLSGVAHWSRMDEDEFFDELVRRHPRGSRVVLNGKDFYSIRKAAEARKKP